MKKNKLQLLVANEKKKKKEKDKSEEKRFISVIEISQKYLVINNKSFLQPVVTLVAIFLKDIKKLDSNFFNSYVNKIL